MAQRMGVADRFDFDSAGTHDYHVGYPPDPRTIRAAEKRGYGLTQLRARRVVGADFYKFDWLLAMGSDHLEWLATSCPPGQESRLGRLLDFDDCGRRDVPDPYYGGEVGFELVLDLVETASSRLIQALMQSEPAPQ
jgi:protein-tyrosine phosphatase